MADASPLLQAGMRQAIEDFSKTCRFIFTCNYPNKIIPAIHSRCAKIALALESNEKADVAVAFLKRMESMLKQEGVKFERKALVTLIQKYFPDFRRTINELQRLSRAGDLTMEVVEQVSDDVNITKVVKYLKEGDFPAMRQWVAQNVGNDQNIVLRKIYDNLVNFLQPHSIPNAVLLIANYQHRGTTAPDPEINLVACLTECMLDLEYK